MANPDETDQASTISPHQFYFETPLYEVVDETSIDGEIYSGEIDAYSAMYKSPTTYEVSYSSIYVGFSDWDNFNKVKLTNKRKEDDVLFFFVYAADNKYIKVGQVPTLATLQQTELDEKYSKYVDKGELVLLKKAIGLASHGVGAGSFVYLRRIFEKQIKDTFEEHKDELGLKEKDFLAQRMTDKVDVLKAYLPSQLVEMKQIYGVLSLGVHEMTEEQCLKYFAPLRLSIELIMAQKVETEIKKERNKQVRDQIKQIVEETKKDT